MKHPAWCEEDDCESGWHMGSAVFSNDGMARIEVRLSQDVKSGKIELDLGKGNGEFNSYKSSAEIKSQLESLKSFHTDLGALIKSIESGL